MSETLHCYRCHGIMIKDLYISLEESMESYHYRCINCGNIIELMEKDNMLCKYIPEAARSKTGRKSTHE